MIDKIREFFDIITSEFGIGVLAVLTVVVIGLVFYGAKRWEEN